MQKRQLTPLSGSLSTKSSNTQRKSPHGILSAWNLARRSIYQHFQRTTKPLLNGEKRLFSCKFWCSALPWRQVGPAAHCPCNTLVQQHLVQQHAFSCKSGAVEDVALLDLVDKPSAECLLVNANAYSCVGFLAKVSGQVNDGAASG